MAPFDSSAPGAESALVVQSFADPSCFKEALARLAGGLAIVSGWEGDEPHGLLVSSITGLSVDPPRFLFCVRKEASSHGAFLRDDLCGVTILSAEDESEAQTFVQPALRNQRFQSGRWSLKSPAPPLLEGGLSSAACTIDARIDAGSHTILVATAQSVRFQEGEPLLSFNRGFRRLA
jgi:flavin reductase